MCYASVKCYTVINCKPKKEMVVYRKNIEKISFIKRLANSTKIKIYINTLGKLEDGKNNYK